MDRQTFEAAARGIANLPEFAAAYEDASFEAFLQALNFTGRVELDLGSVTMTMVWPDSHAEECLR